MHIYNKVSILSLIASVAVFQVVGGLIGYLTSSGVDGWYQSLTRSPFTPPDSAFGIAWSILYLMLAISFWLVYEAKGHPQRKFLLGFFAAHMILNWVWSPLFFTFHAVLGAYLLILVMIFTAAMLAYLIWNVNRFAALLFIPYIAWLTFAGHLSEFIWRHN